MGRKETQINHSEIGRALAKTRANIVPIINLKASHWGELGAALQILETGQRSVGRVRNKRRKAAAGITAHRPNTAGLPCPHTALMPYRFKAALKAMAAIAAIRIGRTNRRHIADRISPQNRGAHRA